MRISAVIGIIMMFVLVTTTLGSCGRATEEQCKSACTKVMELAIDKSIADRKIEDKEQEKKVREEMMTRGTKELENCVTECKKKGTAKQVKCIEQAQSHDEIQKCK